MTSNGTAVICADHGNRSDRQSLRQSAALLRHLSRRRPRYVCAYLWVRTSPCCAFLPSGWCSAYSPEEDASPCRSRCRNRSPSTSPPRGRVTPLGWLAASPTTASCTTKAARSLEPSQSNGGTLRLE